MPRFTFFGYRYSSITATGQVTIRKLDPVPVTSIAKELELGRIETGEKDVNRLISNVKWGQYSNYLSVPTDCPQGNERLGWTADTQVFTEAASCNADVYGFLFKWMCATCATASSKRRDLIFLSRRWRSTAMRATASAGQMRGSPCRTRCGAVSATRRS